MWFRNVEKKTGEAPVGRVNCMVSSSGKKDRQSKKTTKAYLTR